MTATQQFIEDAIKGGWPFSPLPENFKSATELAKEPEFILLSPLPWQAVGRTRGWEDFGTQSEVLIPRGKNEQHQFLDELWNGKTIEEALEAIS